MINHDKEGGRGHGCEYEPFDTFPHIYKEPLHRKSKVSVELGFALVQRVHKRDEAPCFIACCHGQLHV
jgi:hypothetical protein